MSDTTEGAEMIAAPPTEARVRMIDIVAQAGFDDPYWRRLLEQDGDALRLRLGWDPVTKTFPGWAMRFFEFVTAERQKGNKKASKAGAMDLFAQWWDSIQVRPTQGGEEAGAGALVRSPGGEIAPDLNGAARGGSQLDTMLAQIVHLSVQEIVALTLPTPPQRYLTVKQVAEKMQLPPSWVRKHVPSLKLDGTRSRRWREADVDRFMASIEVER